MNVLTNDNFFDDEFTVDEVREFGLSQFIGKNLINDHIPNYPGIRSEPLHTINLKLCDYIVKKITYPISKLAELKKINLKKNYELRIQYHLTPSIHGCGLIHTDLSCVAGVIYLNPNSPPNSGTMIYSLRNKNPYTNIEFKKRVLKNSPIAHTTKDSNIISEFYKEKKIYNEKYWDLEYEIINKYNSMVLYPGYYWHSPGEYSSFGNSIEDSRLVMVLFFNTFDSDKTTS